MLKGLQTGAVFRKSVSQYGSKGLKMFMPSVPAVLPLGIFPEKYSFFMAAKFLKQSNCPKIRNDRNDGTSMWQNVMQPLKIMFNCWWHFCLRKWEGRSKCTWRVFSFHFLFFWIIYPTVSMCYFYKEKLSCFRIFSIIWKSYDIMPNGKKQVIHLHICKILHLHIYTHK